MDVNLSLPLGRPLGLSWDWVDTKMPSLLADSDLQKGISESAPGGLPCPAKKLLHHVIRLRQLQAEIYRTQYPVAASRREPDYRWMEDVQSRLEQWRAESPPVLDNAAIVHDTWSLISYHISISLLNRPCPGNPKPTERQLERALDSSSATMQTFKNMYRRGSISMGKIKIISGGNDRRLLSVAGYQSFIHGRSHLSQLPTVSSRHHASTNNCRSYVGRPGLLLSLGIFSLSVVFSWDIVLS